MEISQKIGKEDQLIFRRSSYSLPLETDSVKDQYYDLNDESIFGNSHDPRARQLKQQTRCLMNSLTTMSKQARVNATCRRRVVENSQEMGEDHVVEVKIIRS